MRIKDIRLTPLHCPLKQLYHWSQGLIHDDPVAPIEI